MGELYQVFNIFHWNSSRTLAQLIKRRCVGICYTQKGAKKVEETLNLNNWLCTFPLVITLFGIVWLQFRFETGEYVYKILWG